MSGDKSVLPNSPLLVDLGKKRVTLAVFLERYELSAAQRLKVMYSIYNFRQRHLIGDKVLGVEEVRHLEKAVQRQLNSSLFEGRKVVRSRSVGSYHDGGGSVRASMRLMVEKLRGVDFDRVVVRTRKGDVHYGPGIVSREFFRDLNLPRGTLDNALNCLVGFGVLSKVKRGLYRFDLSRAGFLGGAVGLSGVRVRLVGNSSFVGCLCGGEVLVRWDDERFPVSVMKVCDLEVVG